MTGPEHITFTPGNALPKTPQEALESQKFDAMVQRTLAETDRAIKESAACANASNCDGDTLTINGKGNNLSRNTPNKLYYAFQVGVDYVKTLIDSADGMRKYTNNPSWSTFPERGIVNSPKANDPKAVQEAQWGKGFNDDYTLHSPVDGVSGDNTFIKGQKDGTMDGQERNLASQQLEWDKDKGINPHAAGNAQNLLQSLFDSNGQIRPEFDTNRNGKFDQEDAETLSKLVDESGTGKPILSSDDLDKASKDYILGR